MIRIASLLAAALCLGFVAAPTAAAAPQRVVAGYFAGWEIYDRRYFPKDIPTADYTHVIYAFAKPSSTAKCALFDPWADYQRPFSRSESVDGVADSNDQAIKGNFNQLRKLKAAHPGLKLLISIGGWTDSKYFSDAARTSDSRRAFVKSCVKMFLKPSGIAAGIFDGIDIDWEFPVCCGYPGNVERATDRHHATLLFKEFRRQLDALGAANGRHYLLTAALPSASDQLQTSYELSKVAGVLSWINVMTYEMHGSWDAYTDFASPFKADASDANEPAASNTIKGTVKLFRSNGVPASKLVIGIPFYAKQYIRVPSANHGLYQTFDNSGLDESSWEMSEFPTYHDLVDVGHVVNGGGFTRYWSDAAGEPSLYNPAAPRGGELVGSFISYEDPASIAERVAYIRKLGLRGAMVWELSQDDDGHDLSDTLGALTGS